MMQFILKPRKKSVALLSVIMSLAIVGILSGMYLGGGPGAAPGAKPWPVQQTDRARDAVCAANRRTALNELAFMQIDHGASVLSSANIQSTAQKLPPCPGEGKFFIHKNEIFCTLHTPTETYRGRLGL